MGWVLAKLREPGEGRPKYSWNIAQIHVGSLLRDLTYC